MCLLTLASCNPNGVFRSDILLINSDKAVPKAVPKMVLRPSERQHLLAYIKKLREFWCPGEDVELSVFPFSYSYLFLFKNIKAVPKAVLVLLN